MISVDDTLDRFHGRAPGEQSCFWSRAGLGYRDGLARMAEVDGHVSDIKLQPFTARLLVADPLDVRAHWTIIGFDVRCCSNSLTEQSWKALFDVGEFEPRWLVEYHYWVQLTSGVDTPLLLADLVRRHRLLDAVGPALQALRNDDDQWVSHVVALAS